MMERTFSVHNLADIDLDKIVREAGDARVILVAVDKGSMPDSPCKYAPCLLMLREDYLEELVRTANPYEVVVDQRLGLDWGYTELSAECWSWKPAWVWFADGRHETLKLPGGWRAIPALGDPEEVLAQLDRVCNPPGRQVRVMTR
jgi:hypothetical protein